jgi:pyridoxal phosphate enzyme (YggS family)
MTPAAAIDVLPLDPTRSTAVRAAVAAVRADLLAACRRAGRDVNGVRLVGVTKTVDAAGARALFEAGVADLGENRVVDGAEKAAALAAPGGATPTWHLIGTLQRNKVRRALEAFAWIHAVDSLRLLETLDRIAGELGVAPRCLLQVNVAQEPQKHGFAPDDVPAAVARAAACVHARCVGLMAMAPLADDPEASRPHFAALRALRDRTTAATGVALPELSMGMSQDFAVAVEEGATLVRVGTALTAALRSAPGPR